MDGGPVLVVCSDPECSSMLLGVIKDYGLEASAARNVHQARTHLQQPDLSLVLCESSLPDGSFREAEKLEIIVVFFVQERFR